MNLQIRRLGRGESLSRGRTSPWIRGRLWRTCGARSGPTTVVGHIKWHHELRLHPSARVHGGSPSRSGTPAWETTVRNGAPALLGQGGARTIVGAPLLWEHRSHLDHKRRDRPNAGHDERDREERGSGLKEESSGEDAGGRGSYDGGRAGCPWEGGARRGAAFPPRVFRTVAQPARSAGVARASGGDAGARAGADSLRRMLVSPFTFYRGAALIMANDLS